MWAHKEIGNMSKQEQYTDELLEDSVPPSCAMTVRYLQGQESGTHIAKIGHMDRTAGDVFLDVGNAKRLAAAWNACHGVPTVDLKTGVVATEREQLAACKRLLEGLLQASKALRDTPENQTDEPSEELARVMDWTDVNIRAAELFLK